MSDVKPSPRLQQRATDIAAGLVLPFFFNLVFFPGIWVSETALYYRDIVVNYLPLRLFFREQVFAGNWPLWTERLNSGQPFWADPVNSILYPGHLPLLAFDDPVLSYGIMTVSHFFLAHMGFYVWLRAEGNSVTAASIGSVVIVYSGVLLNAHAALQFLFAWSWCGWYFAALRLALTRSTPLLLLLPVACLWVIITSGEIQTVMILGALTLLYPLLISKAPLSARNFLKAMSIPALSALLAAPVLLPAYELSVQTTRLAANTFKSATEWSLHPLRLIEWFVPGVFGDPENDPIWWAYGVTRSSLWGFYTPSISLGYFGIMVAAAGIFGRRYLRTDWFWLVIGLVAFILSTGDYLPFYRLFYEYVPFWKAFKFPERLLFWTTVAIGWFIARGIDRSFEQPTSFLGIALVSLLVALGEYFLPQTGGLKFFADTVYGSPATAEILHWLSSFLYLSAAWWLAAAICLLFIWRIRHSAGKPALVMIVAVNLLLINARLVPEWPREAYEMLPSTVENLISTFPDSTSPRPAPIRIDSTRYVTELKTEFPQKKGPLLALLTWNTMTGNLPLLTSWAGMRGYNSSELIARRSIQNLTSPGDFAALTGTEYVAIFPDAAEGDSTLACGPKIRDTGIPGLVWCNYKRAFPPAYCPVNWKQPNDISELTRRIQITRFAATGPRFAYLGSLNPNRPMPDIPFGSPSGEPAESEVHCTVASWNDEHRIIEADKPFDGPVIIRDINYPGWYARTETGDVPLLSANGAFIAAWVPAGKHQVTFEFRPDSIRTGLIIAFVTLIVIVLIFILVLWRRQLH